MQPRQANTHASAAQRLYGTHRGSLVSVSFSFFFCLFVFVFFLDSATLASSWRGVEFAFRGWGLGEGIARQSPKKQNGRNVLDCVTRVPFHNGQGSLSTDRAVDGCSGF